MSIIRHLFLLLGLLQGVQKVLTVRGRLLHHILHLLHSVNGVLNLFIQVLLSLEGDLCEERRSTYLLQVCSAAPDTDKSLHFDFRLFS